MESENAVPPPPPVAPDTAREIFPMKFIERGADSLSVDEETITFADFRPTVVRSDVPVIAEPTLPKDLFAQEPVLTSELLPPIEGTVLASPVQIPVEKDSGVPILNESGKPDSSSAKNTG